MKAFLAAEDIKSKALKNDTTVGVLLHVFTFICGFIFANAPVCNNLLPFGAAFTGGEKRKYLAAASGGSALGYIISFSNGGFVYAASVFAITTIRVILSGERFARAPVFSGCLSFLAAGVIRLAVLTSYGGNITTALTEAALAGAAA